jgi:hypothetical protein
MKQSWSNAAITRRDVSSDDLVKVIDVVKGNSAQPLLNKVLSTDSKVRVPGIIEYKSKLRNIADMIGIPVTNEICSNERVQ